MITKELVLQSLEKMPAEFTVDELLEKIVFLSKIERGLKDIEEGKVYEDEDILDSIIRRKQK